MANEPFQWGFGGQAITSPEQAARKRAIADALIGQSATPGSNWAEGLADVAAALSGTVLGGRVDEAETAGRERAGGLFADLAVNADPNSIIAALTNPDAAWASPAQTSIASALLNSGLDRADPMYQMNVEKAQLELDALRNPVAKPQPLMSVGENSSLYDPNAGAWISPPTGADGMTAAPNVKGESDLRKEYGAIPTVKDFGLQTQAYQRVLDSARDPSAAGDLALIFNFMKVLDPGSTVREGEFATAQNSGSVPDQIMAQYNKVMSGERLVPEIRQDFVQRAGQLYEGAAGLQQGTNDRYSGLAEQYGYDPTRIVAPVPTIGVMDPKFNVQEYMTPQGTLDPNKPLPVTNDAEYEAIPSGATFKAPDGSIRVKP